MKLAIYLQNRQHLKVGGSNESYARPKILRSPRVSFSKNFSI